MDSESKQDPRGQAYAGQSACAKCHQQTCASYLQTAHQHAAALASFATIAGSFSKDSNSLIVNDSVKVVMENRKGIPYQVLYVKGKETNEQAFDIVFGSAKGQTYLYWKEDRLFQLPISYFTALHSWTTSPGYPSDRLIFDRPISERCFECHTSYIAASSEQAASFRQNTALDKSTLICSIDCERCHGPAAEHVKFHTMYPSEKIGRYIVAYNSLSRTQKMDMCAVCHSGNKNIMISSTFRFKPGNHLSHFMLSSLDSPRSDVHGNQAGLLALSKCYLNSNMDCSTCHNLHVNERGNHAAFAQHCQTCHSLGNHNFCGMAGKMDSLLLKNNCTQCHMPEQSSAIIKVKGSDTKTNMAILMVNHRIGIYQNESEKIKAALEKNEK